MRYFEPSTLVLGRFMLNCMKLQFQDAPLKVLEIGAGAGGLAKELLSLSDVCIQELKVSDISNGMLEQAADRLEGFDHNGVVTIEKADATKLPYEDSRFDRYFANMVLLYVDDPMDMIQEAHRVLAPGGIAGFTVWGRSKDSPLMTIVPDVLEEFGLRKKDPILRSSFHLGQDDTALRNKFFDCGFEKCTVMHYPCAMECLDATSFVEMIIEGAASTKAEIESFSQEDQKRVREEVFRRGKNVLDNGLPIALDCAVIIARKADE